LVVFSSQTSPSQVLVAGVGLEGWDGTLEGRGTYEDEGVLQTLFEELGVGTVRAVVVPSASCVMLHPRDQNFHGWLRFPYVACGAV
jgi:hypothetical protein